MKQVILSTAAMLLAWQYPYRNLQTLQDTWIFKEVFWPPLALQSACWQDDRAYQLRKNRRQRGRMQNVASLVVLPYLVASDTVMRLDQLCGGHMVCQHCLAYGCSPGVFHCYSLDSSQTLPPSFQLIWVLVKQVEHEDRDESQANLLRACSMGILWWSIGTLLLAWAAGAVGSWPSLRSSDRVASTAVSSGCTTLPFTRKGC